MAKNAFSVYSGEISKEGIVTMMEALTSTEKLIAGEMDEDDEDMMDPDDVVQILSGFVVITFLLVKKVKLKESNVQVCSQQ